MASQNLSLLSKVIMQFDWLRFKVYVIQWFDYLIWFEWVALFTMHIIADQRSKMTVIAGHINTW